MIVIAERYADKYLAYELLKRLKLDEEVKVDHRQVYGGDCVIKALDRGEGPAIAIVDYEAGIARRYVDSFFTQRRLAMEGAILGVRVKGPGKAAAVILGPTVEEPPSTGLMESFVLEGRT